jgi:hypothetical protein
MSGMKPIETRYRGYRFRSRLEARWAVFFESLGIAWEYEKEGYDLAELGWYLPDFWLPQQGCWIEVKPDEPDAADLGRVTALASHTGHDVCLLIGPIPQVEPATVRGEVVWPGSANAINVAFGDVENAVDCGHQWHECSLCHYVAIRYPESDKRLRCGCQGRDVCTSDRLIRAYDAARSARFEHGEQGAG